MTNRPRRDFLLDGGAVSALAPDKKILDTYLGLLESRFEGLLRIPVPVITEFHIGDPHYDAVVHRLINKINIHGQLFSELTRDLAYRAGVLHHEAVKIAKDPKLISAVDAQVVAIAEQLSRRYAVTIVTGDPDDMSLLVSRTRRANIAVRRVG